METASGVHHLVKQAATSKINQSLHNQLKETSAIPKFHDALNIQDLKQVKKTAPSDITKPKSPLYPASTPPAIPAAGKQAYALKSQNLLSASEAGTDLALKQLSCELEQQILGTLWNLAFASMNREFQGGLGEELFHKELVDEMVKFSKTGEMGDIARSIYEDLKSQKDRDFTE